MDIDNTFDAFAINFDTAPVAYCYDDDGIYTHTEPFSIDPLESEHACSVVWLQPANSLTAVPGKPREGYAQQRAGNAWEEVEDHRGREIFVDGVPFTVKKCGPLPEGWSDTPPPPTNEELFARLRMLRDTRLRDNDAKIAQITRRMRNGEETKAELATLDAYADALCSLPAQPGAPWDGGGPLTPWPTTSKFLTTKF